MSNSPITSSYITTTESTLGGEIRRMLESDEMLIGDGPSYELAKSCFLYHPLGRKMAEGPIALAQSQKRRITVGNAPAEVAQQFEREWKRLKADKHIANAARLARIYGISTLILGVGQNENADQALDPATLAEKDVWFSSLDPLNTAGSLVLSQIPTSPDFNKPVTVRTNGKVFHPSRFVVVMNEEPIYLAYTNAAFGFVGRSVYQRALFPMKSYLRSMIANDMIQSKLGLIVARLVSPGPAVTKEMGLLAALKRAFVKQAKTGQVLTIGEKEEIETLNMQNVDGAGTYSRTNILKDIAGAADMPAKLLDQETLVSGFGEGTEDAKTIARYIDSIREWLEPLYEFLSSVVQRRAWDGNFIRTMQSEYAEIYGGRGEDEIFSQWRADFAVEWPSFLIEPESEQVRVDDVRLQAAVAVVQTVMEIVDPESQLEALKFLADNVSANKRLFPHALEFDWETLQNYLQDQAAQRQSAGEDPAAQNGGVEQVGPEAKRFGRFDASSAMETIRAAVTRMDAERARTTARRAV